MRFPITRRHTKIFSSISWVFRVFYWPKADDNSLSKILGRLCSDKTYLPVFAKNVEFEKKKTIWVQTWNVPTDAFGVFFVDSFFIVSDRWSDRNFYKCFSAHYGEEIALFKSAWRKFFFYISAVTNLTFPLVWSFILPSFQFCVITVIVLSNSMSWTTFSSSASEKSVR